MFARLNALRIELDIGENKYYYDEGYTDSPLIKAGEIYQEYGLELPENDFNLYDSRFNNYLANFQDEDGKEYWHIFYNDERKDSMLNFMNRADCEGKFLLCTNNTIALEHLLVSIGSNPNIIKKVQPELIPLISSLCVYKRDFYSGKMHDIAFMGEMKLKTSRTDFYKAFKYAKELVFEK